MPDSARLDGYLGGLSAEQAAAWDHDWESDHSGDGSWWQCLLRQSDAAEDPSAEWRRLLAFDATVAHPHPVVVLHTDVTRMIEYAAAGAGSPLKRRGFTFPDDLRAAVVAAAPGAGYAFECLGKATYMAAQYASSGNLLSDAELAAAATGNDGFRGHQLLVLFENLSAHWPQCVPELRRVLGDPLSRAAVHAVDAFIRRWRYHWQDEVRSNPDLTSFDSFVFALHNVYYEVHGGVDVLHQRYGALGTLDALLRAFAGAVVDVYFALTVGLWRATLTLGRFPSATLLAAAAKVFPAEADDLLGVVLVDAPPGWQVRQIGGGRWGHYGVPC